MSRPFVTDPRTLGEQFVRWALGQEATPGEIEMITATDPIEDLKREIGGSYSIPDHITHFKFVQHSENHMILKLPPAAMVQETEDKFGNESPGQNAYPLPAFYAPKVMHNIPQNNREFFRFRIADYMTGLCH